MILCFAIFFFCPINFCFSFSVFALKNCGFSVWCFVRVAGFLRFSLWFSFFFQHQWRVFGFFCPIRKPSPDGLLVQCILPAVFLVLPRKFHPAVALKL